MYKGFLIRAYLMMVIVAYGCGSLETHDDKMDSQSLVDTPLPAVGGSIGTELPDETTNTTVPDTSGGRKYYGEDYDGDTVLYVERGKMLTEGTVTGTFVEIQRGDYLHLILLDEQGWCHSFWILFDDRKLMDQYWEGVQPDPGQKIRVNWIRTREYMYEARKEIVIYKMTKLETLDK